MKDMADILEVSYGKLFYGAQLVVSFGMENARSIPLWTFYSVF